MNIGACVADASLVSLKLVESDATPARTEKAPLVPFAVKVGAVATPLASLTA